MTTQIRNEVLLEGIPSSQPEWSHENHGTQFYRFFLQVPRLSGTLLSPGPCAKRLFFAAPRWVEASAM